MGEEEGERVPLRYEVKSVVPKPLSLNEWPAIKQPRRGSKAAWRVTSLQLTVQMTRDNAHTLNKARGFPRICWWPTSGKCEGLRCSRSGPDSLPSCKII